MRIALRSLSILACLLAAVGVLSSQPVPVSIAGVRILPSGIVQQTSAPMNIIKGVVLVNGERRRTALTLPEGDEKVPGILFIGGIGCYGLEYRWGGDNPYKWLLDNFAEAGYATFCVEKTGMGSSEGTPCDQADFETETAGYREALHAFRENPRIDPDRIVLVGHSIGGLIAPVLAAKERVAGVVVMGIIGKSWFEYELENTRRQLRMAGVAYPEIDDRVRELELFNHLLFVEKKTPSLIVREHPELKSHARLAMHYTYMQQLADLNLAREWSEVDAPALIVYGGSDFLTDSTQHAYAAAAMNSAHPRKASFVVIPRMDHAFHVFDDQQESFQHSMQGDEYNAQLPEEIFRWLKAQIKKSNRIEQLR